MNRYGKIIVLALLAGLLVGFISSEITAKDKMSKCEKTEEAIKNNSSIKGAIACFEPGVINVNQTDRVDQGAELECVCRRSYNGRVSIWAINKAN